MHPNCLGAPHHNLSELTNGSCLGAHEASNVRNSRKPLYRKPGDPQTLKRGPGDPYMSSGGEFSLPRRLPDLDARCTADGSQLPDRPATDVG